jgi:two-component system response regulator MprA
MRNYAEFRPKNSAAFPRVFGEDGAMDGGTHRIAVIDDEENIRELLEVSLAIAGFEVRSAPDASHGLVLVREWEPDCIVLDVMMPRMDGISVLPLLRRITEVPVLLLTARDDIDDRVEGLNTGADDYIPKPFEVRELVARINKALRRPSLKRVSHIRLADLEIDLEARTVRRGKRWISTTMREFDLVATLARRPRRVFTRNELMDLVWGIDHEVMPSTIDTYVSYVRTKIDGPGEARLIHTVRGVGFSMRTDS